MGATEAEYTNPNPGWMFYRHCVDFTATIHGEQKRIKVTGYSDECAIRSRESASLYAIEELRNHGVIVVDYNSFFLSGAREQAAKAEILLMHSKGTFWSLLSKSIATIGRFGTVRNDLHVAAAVQKEVE